MVNFFKQIFGGVETGSMYVQYVQVIPIISANFNKFIKFRGCLEAASKRTNVPLSSAHTWTLFQPPNFLTFNLAEFHQISKFLLPKDNFEILMNF